MSDARIPATVVTGFLGAGKTTFLNHVLHQQTGKKIAVIINEIGDVNVDSFLVENESDERIVEFNNGCLCCTVRGDLIEMLGKLQQRPGKLDGIIIETSGLADPAPVASTFFVSDEVRASVRLDSFVSLIDAVNIDQNLEQCPEAVEQVAFSDIILINKSDLVDAARLEAVHKKMRALNPMAAIHHTTNGVIDLDRVIDTGAFELEAKLQVDPEFLGDHEHEHDASVGSFVLTMDRPIDMNRFMIWMNDMAQSRGDDLFRTKGIFYASGFRERLVFHSVRMLTSFRPDRPWRDDEVKSTIFVVIGRNLDRDEFAHGLEACAARV